MTPVVKDEKKAEAILAWAVDKMEERYEWLHRARVRNIASYNELPFEEIVRRVNPDSEEELRNDPAADAVHRHRHRRGRPTSSCG